MSDLCAGASRFLLDVYDHRRGLFPFSTTFADGSFVNDYEHPHTIRYTINSLLGLRRAALHGSSAPPLAEVDGMIATFMREQSAEITSFADLGLLALLLTEAGDRGPRNSVVERLGVRAADERALASSNLQELGWMLWGSCAAAGDGAPGAADAADLLFQAIIEGFVDPRTGLARHSRSLYRRSLVSFGSTTYFLRSMYEYWRLREDRSALRLFVEGTISVASLQGPAGEWPWLINIRTARPVEFYPVFAVHQDSMAMLFLLPALDEGLVDAREAIARSFAWDLGGNELGIPMLKQNPYFAHRSIERRDPLPRVSRYGRTLVNRLTGGGQTLAGGRRVKLNPECRSYHLGWILYAWAGRSDVPGTEGERWHDWPAVAAEGLSS